MKTSLYSNKLHSKTQFQHFNVSCSIIFLFLTTITVSRVWFTIFPENIGVFYQFPPPKKIWLSTQSNIWSKWKVLDCLFNEGGKNLTFVLRLPVTFPYVLCLRMSRYFLVLSLSFFSSDKIQGHCTQKHWVHALLQMQILGQIYATLGDCLHGLPNCPFLKVGKFSNRLLGKWTLRIG